MLGVLPKSEKVDLNFRLGYSNENKEPTHEQEEIRLP